MPAEEHWNYAEDSGHGPSEWTKYFPAGKLQSPINILVDYCDLHLSSCSSCQHDSSDAHQRLPMRNLKLNSGNEPIMRRGHLDSVGNEADSDEQLGYESDISAQQKCCYENNDNNNRSPSSNNSNGSSDSNNKKASDCLTLWKSKKLAGPLQMMRKAQQEEQQQTKQNTRYCVTNKKIFLGYPRYLNSIKLSNTGHGWQVDMAQELAYHTLLCGPPFGDREYRLAQFHCHWGADQTHGSEHQVNGQSYSAELHFVHWNCSQFKSIEEAARHKHGLAVLGVFVQALEGEQNRNKHLDKLMRGIQMVREEPHSSVELTDTKLDLKKLFPSNRWNYATYEGSLTTPPLSEVVDWLVFLQPIQCSSNQIDQFRRLKCPEGALLKNCRPIQAHNQRTVTIWTHSNSH